MSYADIDHIGGKLLDFEQVDAGVNLVWAPTAGLTIGAEVDYKTVDFAIKGAKSVDSVVGLLRIQRSF